MVLVLVAGTEVQTEGGIGPAVKTGSLEKVQQTDLTMY